MKKTFIFGALTVLIGLIACKKDNVDYVTIKPLEYFPAFPGSYWVYDNNETLKVDRYEKYVYNSAGYASQPVYETYILPKLILNGIYNDNDTYAYVKGYSISKPNISQNRDPAFKELLSLTGGANFNIGGSFGGHQIMGKTINADTTIYIGTTKYENVIMIIQYDYGCVSSFGSPEHCANTREYYAKNVGLIKRERRNSIIDTDFVKEIELIDYEIKK